MKVLSCPDKLQAPTCTPNTRQTHKAFLPNSEWLWFSSQIPIKSRILRIPGRHKKEDLLGGATECSPRSKTNPTFPNHPAPTRGNPERAITAWTQKTSPIGRPLLSNPPQPHASLAKCDITTGRVPCLNQSNDLASLDLSVLFLSFLWIPQLQLGLHTVNWWAYCTVVLCKATLQRTRFVLIPKVLSLCLLLLPPPFFSLF